MVMRGKVEKSVKSIITVAVATVIIKSARPFCRRSTVYD